MYGKSIGDNLTEFERRSLLKRLEHELSDLRMEKDILGYPRNITNNNIIRHEELEVRNEYSKLVNFFAEFESERYHNDIVSALTG